jgi:2,3-bisphosphoglycerate-dependent phosphoglycerate mutase
MERSMVLVRHGQSEGNLLNIFTGWTDVGLSEQGLVEASSVGLRLKEIGVSFDVIFTSALRRASDTAAIILNTIGQAEVETIRDKALNERNYGELTGLNKDEARARWGDAQVQTWRRSYDIPPPAGESLKDTAARVLPFYLTHILPRVMRCERTLVVAHGNSLRALVMVLDNHTPETIPTVEFVTGHILLYELAADTTVKYKSESSGRGCREQNGLPGTLGVGALR